MTLAPLFAILGAGKEDHMKHLFKFGKKACASMAWVTLFLGAAPWVAAQEAYPNKPIRMLLGYPPGGGSDIIARLIAKPLGDRLGQSVVVDNKPGASGNIAAEMAARANPDGYTLLFVPSGLATSAAMKKSMPFQPVNDFFWISTVTTYPIALAVVPGSPIRSFGDLVAKAKAEPNKISYSSVGVGTAMHLVTEWIQSEAGIQLNHIPFKGGTGPMTELLAGRIDVMVDTMTLTAKLVHEGRVRALATTALPGKSPLPGVPAVADTYPGMVYESWLGIVAPAGTPPAIIERLNKEIRAVVDMPDVRQKMIDFGGQPQASSPTEFKSRVERDIASMRKVMAERKIEQE
jgi:tripartite-type tricarboxylate transporter receptor subunit TctC